MDYQATNWEDAVRFFHISLSISAAFVYEMQDDIKDKLMDMVKNNTDDL
jgi:hypothetical protein